MEYKFLNYQLLETVFDNGSSSEILEDNYFIASISDVLYVTEMYKKGIFKIDSQKLYQNKEFICNTIENSGSVNVLELDYYTLKSNLFNDLTLDESIANRIISPRHSISRTILKIDDHSIWDNNLVDEMEEYYSNSESL
jgi:hypothetical protein